jgi:hypothetical protein
MIVNPMALRLIMIIGSAPLKIRGANVTNLG